MSLSTQKLTIGDWLEMAPEDVPPEKRHLVRAFHEGRRLARRGTASSTSESTSSDAGSQNRRSGACSALVMAETAAPDAPSRRLATMTECRDLIVRLGFRTGHVVAAERIPSVAEALVWGSWTAGEVLAAERTIVTDSNLLKEITYARTIGPQVFTEARKRLAVRRERLVDLDEAREYARERGVAIGELFEAVRAAEDTDRVLWRAVA